MAGKKKRFTGLGKDRKKHQLLPPGLLSTRPVCSQRFPPPASAAPTRSGARPAAAPLCGNEEAAEARRDTAAAGPARSKSSSQLPSVPRRGSCSPTRERCDTAVARPAASLRPRGQATASLHFRLQGGGEEITATLPARDERLPQNSFRWSGARSHFRVGNVRVIGVVTSRSGSTAPRPLGRWVRYVPVLLARALPAGVF